MPSRVGGVQKARGAVGFELGAEVGEAAQDASGGGGAAVDIDLRATGSVGEDGFVDDVAAVENLAELQLSGCGDGMAPGVGGARAKALVEDASGCRAGEGDHGNAPAAGRGHQAGEGCRRFGHATSIAYRRGRCKMRVDLRSTAKRCGVCIDLRDASTCGERRRSVDG
jgi:hypothetical protein